MGYILPKNGASIKPRAVQSVGLSDESYSKSDHLTLNKLILVIGSDRETGGPRAMPARREWRGRDGNDPSVDIAKDADQRF
jgi:hypothetical protein